MSLIAPFVCGVILDQYGLYKASYVAFCSCYPLTGEVRVAEGFSCISTRVKHSDRWSV